MIVQIFQYVWYDVPYDVASNFHGNTIYFVSKASNTARILHYYFVSKEYKEVEGATTREMSNLKQNKDRTRKNNTAQKQK